MILAPRPVAGHDGPGLATTHGVRARHDELIGASAGLHFSI
jgi:hypothetical protein